MTKNIASKVGKNLHCKKNHPLNLIRSLIENYCQEYMKTQSSEKFQIFDSLNPIVTTKNNFDDLMVPVDHPSRNPSDTYYIDGTHLLRTHTSAHQTTLISKRIPAFLVSGDVYRRDEIDSRHYPVFHQMEGVRIFQNTFSSEKAFQSHIESDLKSILTGLARELFGNDVSMKWTETSFPFTHPSFELEVLYEDKWLEVLGCGVIHPGVIASSDLNCGRESGWAFGLGLDRLAMVLFKIPDIRLFWSNDERFLSQFYPSKPGKSIREMIFSPYSKYPQSSRDISFYQSPDHPFSPTDIYDIARSYAHDSIESVTLVDEFVNPRTKQASKCFRLVYRNMDRNLTNAEVDDVNTQVREELKKKFCVILR